MCFSWSVSCFCFHFFFCFVCCNKWLDHIMFLLEEMNSLFICREHSVFHSIRFNECSLFLEPRLAFDFRLDLCSDLVISFHQGVFLPLIFIGFHQKRCLWKVWMVLKKEKALCKKVVQEEACVDCGLGFCMSCLMSFW
jgi:hypothetical protein